MLTLGSGVWGFTYDSMVGEFVLSHPDIRIPEEGKIYAFNEGNYQARALGVRVTCEEQAQTMAAVSMAIISRLLP